MDQQVERQAQEIVQLTQQLEQTERDLAAAILIIQEKSQTDKIEFPLTDDDADNTPNQPRETHAGFGDHFPPTPVKGDMFLRTDQLPHKLYKWNGHKWIEVAKTTTDRYAYEQEYIKYVTQKVKDGEYDFYELSKPEQEEVLKHLDYTTKSQL